VKHPGSASYQVRGSSSERLPLLRPMEIGELLDEAFDLYRQNFGLFFGVAVLLSAPFSMVTLAFPQESTERLVASLIGWIPSLITMSALAHVAMERYLGRETTILAAYRQGLRRFLPLLAALLVYAVLAVLGLVLLVIPGLIVSLWSMVLVPVVVVEGRSFRALGRCRQLAEGNMWRLLVLALGLFGVSFVLSFVLGALIGLATVLGGNQGNVPAGDAGSMTILVQAGVLVVATLINGAVMPLWMSAVVLLYADLRIRQEAYDLELLTRAVETRVETARGPRTATGTTGAPAPGQVGG
jgi:hypothetical protein